MRFGILALLLLCLTGEVAGSMTNAKFALHRKNKFSATKAIPNLCDNPSTTSIEPNYSPNYTNTPCDQYSVTGPLGASTIYLVIADAGLEGVGAASFGVDYSGNATVGIDPRYVTFTPCADGLTFPNSGGHGDFPMPGGGVRLTWNTSVSCAKQVIGSYGVHAVVGCFYVYAYSGDVLKITPNNNLQSGPELIVADCQGVTTDLLPIHPGAQADLIMGRVGVADQQLLGFNPCGGLAMPTPVGQWSFDEASSGAGEGIAYDAAPGLHHGAINGAAYIPGILGRGALHFDGTNDFVGVLAAGSSLQLVNTDYTIAWWANPSNLSGVQKLVEMDDGLDNSGGYSAYLDDDYLKLAHNNGQDNTVAFERLNLCGWRHYAVVYSQSVGKRYLYLNGVPFDTISVSGGGLNTDGNDQLYFGAHQGSSQYYRGDLDEVRIYNTSLSTQQIGALVQGAALTGPGIKQVTARDRSSQVKVIFTMPVGTGAGTITNYTLFRTSDPALLIPITSASVQDTIVTLSVGSPLNIATAYTLTVKNVQNLCGVPIPSTINASVQVLDIDPPTLLFVSGYADMDTIRVYFSEPVGPGSNVIGNYQIHPLGLPTDLIPVQNASVLGSNVLLTLSTPLAGGVNYSLEVSNVQDLHGNTIVTGSKIGVIPAVALMGELVSDLTLTKAKPGPRYHLLGDVHIAPGATITMEPGVLVTFTPNFDGFNLGDYPSQTELICDGRLIATGTSQDSVIFKSDGVGSAGVWGQIKFNSGGQGVFSYIALRHAKSGIVVLSGGSATLDHSLLQTVSLDALVNAGTLNISDCTIQKPLQRGIFATQGTLSVVRTNIFNSVMEGVRLEGGSGNLDFLTINSAGFGTSGPKYCAIVSANSAASIRWNAINNCPLDGIAISGIAARGLVSGNKVFNVGGNGIHITDSAQDTVQFCDISACTASGIFFENSGSGEFVTNCLITGAQDGIRAQGGGDLAVRYTTISGCRGSGLDQLSSSGAELSVRSTIIVSNQGWGIRDLATATDDDIRFVDSWNNTAGQYSGTACDSICLASNPLFAAPGDYRLTSTSPLRFFGENMTQMGRYGPDQTDVVGIGDGDVTELRLPLANYPNPFARSTTIAFAAESAGEGDVDVYSVTGRLVRKEHVQVAKGVNQIAFQRGDMASGLYFYRVSWSGHQLTSKMILLP